MSAGMENQNEVFAKTASTCLNGHQGKQLVNVKAGQYSYHSNQQNYSSGQMIQTAPAEQPAPPPPLYVAAGTNQGGLVQTSNRIGGQPSNRERERDRNIPPTN